MCNSGKPRGSTRAEWCAKSRSRERAGKGLGRPANGKARAPFDGDRVRGCDCTPTLLTENMQIAPPFVGGPPHWPSHVHISPTKVLLATGGFPLMAFVVHSRETQKYTPRGKCHTLRPCWMVRCSSVGSAWGGRGRTFGWRGWRRW